MKRICVYSGSTLGIKEEYKSGAKLLGKTLADNNIEMVYGGAKVGLMGSTADEALVNNGKVIGVMPEVLFSSERVHEKLTKFIKTKDMQERKKTMFDLSDGFIALPGGLGTYEELFEVLSWAKIGIHKKPIGLLNIEGFFNPLIKMIENTISEGFMYEENMNLILTADNPDELIKKMKNYV